MEWDEAQRYLDEKYDHKFSQQKRSYYEYQQIDPNNLTMITDVGLKIYWQLNEDLDSQLSNLYRYVAEEQKYDLTGVEYIDLRHGNQIIVK